MGWRIWLTLWSPVLVLSAAWTAATVRPSAVVGALVLYSLWVFLVVGGLRTAGDAIPWRGILAGAAWGASMLGPLASRPLLGLAAVAAMGLTTPRVVAGLHRRFSPGVGQRPVPLLSDWQLEQLWTATGAELQQVSGPSDRVLEVVLRREELLDELVRRRSGPDEVWGRAAS
jgi:hypothetical protein